MSEISEMAREAAERIGAFVSADNGDDDESFVRIAGIIDQALASQSAEVKQLRNAIRNHRDQRGDDRCWMDDRELYAVLPEGTGDADLRLHGPEEMLENCKRYIASRQNPSQPYVSPQREIKRLQVENESLKTRLRDLARDLILLEADDAGQREKVKLQGVMAKMRSDNQQLRQQLAETKDQLQTVHAHVAEALQLLGVDISVDGCIPDSWTLREQCHLSKVKLGLARAQLDERERQVKALLEFVSGLRVGLADYDGSYTVQLRTPWSAHDSSAAAVECVKQKLEKLKALSVAAEGEGE